MVFKPDSTEDIRDRMEGRLSGKIEKLTNFVRGSFNWLWTKVFSRHLRENHEVLLASQLSGWIDFSGGPITQDELDILKIDSVTPTEINEYMNDSDLDELVKIVGVTRDPGTKATGTVTITVSSDTVTVESGTEFGTQPDSDGDFLSFFTTEDVTPSSGSLTVDAPVEAGDVGEEYNVGSGKITYLVDPPPGVEDVTNNSPTTGGEDPESNQELRERAKNAVLNQSGGGTVRGIEGFIESNVEGVIAAEVDEFPDASPPYADVIVDGGTDADVKDAIQASHPSGVRHNLVRPTIFTIAVDAKVIGEGIDTEDVETLLEEHIAGLDLGQEVYRDKLIQKIMNGDAGIENIEELVVKIVDEPHTFDNTIDIYNLDKQLEHDDGSLSREMGITEVTGTLSGSDHTFTEDTDYQETDDDGDGSHDSIDWSLAGDDPDDGTTFNVDYVTPNDVSITAREKAQPGTINVTVV